MQRDFKRWKPMRLFFSYYKPHKGLFILDMVCAVIVACVDLVYPYVSRISLQRYLPEGMFTTFFIVMGAMIAAYVLRSCLYYIITRWGHKFGVYVEADMRRDLFTHLQTLDFNFYDNNRTGALMSRMTSDLFEITELSHHGPEDVLISLLTLIGAFSVMCTIEWRLAVVVFAIVPLFIVFTVWQRRRMSKANMAVKITTGEINSAIESSVSGVRTTKAYANENLEREKFDRANNEYKGSKDAYYSAMAVFFSGMELALSLMSVLVITVGGYFIMGGTMDYVDIITFSLYVSTFISPVRKLSQFVELYMQGMAGFTRFLELMRTDPRITDREDARELKDCAGDVELDGVSFAYGDAGDVINNVSLKIPAGSSLAVVGPSGGGKTTLCQLIPRFYDVASGSVRVDGIDVRELTQSSLRGNIGIVQQDVFLFAGTVRENIRYGRHDATDAEIVAAAKRARIHEEIMRMPEGYDTHVGERGIMLSGGQKQRISIARVFLKDPPILILDEATSALDSVTEASIQKSFDELSEGRTSIIIAHRLSTIRGADVIALIDGGRIAEMGAHSELLAKNGEYARLYRAQGGTE